MPTIKLNFKTSIPIVLQLRKLSTNKPQEFVIESANDIAAWSSYFLYLLLDAIAENPQHKYEIVTRDSSSMLFRIKGYDNLYRRNMHEKIIITQKGN